MSELSGRKNVIGPFFKVRESDIISWWDDSAFIDAAYQFNNNFLTSVIINNLELSDIVVFLHNPQEFEQDFGDRSEKDLFFALFLGVDYGFEGIC